MANSKLGDSITSLDCRTWVASLCVLALAVVSFCLCYDGEFVFDDSEAVLGNDDIKPTTPISGLLRNDFWGKKLASNLSHKSYRPITVISFRWNYWLAGGLHAVSFHLTNIVLHAVVCVLTLHVFQQLYHPQRCGIFSHRPVSMYALLSTVLYSVHPLHSESVCAVVGRADLLCAMFFFLSLLLYIAACQTNILNRTSMFCLMASMLCCVISVFCKEQGITVLGVCCVYDIIFVARLDPHSFANIGLWKYLRSTLQTTASTSPLVMSLVRQTLLFLTGAGVLGHRWHIMGSTMPTFTPHDNPQSFINDTFLRLINHNYIYSINSALFIFPHWLCFDWSMGCVPIIRSVYDWRIVGVVVMWIVYAALLVSCLRRRLTIEDRLLLFALSFIVIPFLPASNVFFRVGFVVAERALYLPSAGYVIVLTLGVKRLSQARCFSNSQICFKAGVGLVLTMFVLKSMKRSCEWRTELDLYSSGEKVCPLNAKLQYNIGKIHADQGKMDAAVRKYRLAISLNPDYGQPLNNLGVILKDQGQLTEAEDLLTRAILISPQMAVSWMNLGITQAGLNKHREAEESYLTALRHRRTYPDCYYNLANLYMDTGRHQAALSTWRMALSQKPTHANSWNNLIIHLDTLGNLSESIATAQEALTLLPNHASLLYNLANSLGKAGRYEESEIVYKLLLAQEPHNIDAYTNLGVLYHRWGKLKEAEIAYKIALKLYPHARNARTNYDMLLKKMGRMS